MKKIIVLDYEAGYISIKDIPKELEELDGDDILTDMGFDIAGTTYMTVDDRLPISIETKGCTIYTTLK